MRDCRSYYIQPALKYSLIKFLSVIAVLLLWGCVNEEVLLHPPGGRSFWTLKIRDSYTMKRVTAFYAGEGRHAIAYVAVDSSIAEAKVSQVLREFDRNIAPREHALFTTPLDIDGNRKVILLFLDIDDGYSSGSGGGYIAGYFDPLNQFDDESVQEITGRRSNEAEMLYLDTYPSEVGGNEFMSTLAHEYQHLLQFSFNFRNDSDEEKWVDEGLSEIASDLTGYGPQTSRLIGFRRIGNGTLILGDSLISWDGNIDDYNHVYMYFRYLVDAWGEELVTRIFRHTLSDLDGVESALDQHGVTTDCGGYSGGYSPDYARLNCSYRFLWAAILGQTTLQGKTGLVTLNNHMVPAQLLPEHNPMNSLQPGDIGGIQYYVSPPVNAQITEPFSFTFFQNNAINGPPALSNTSCGDCKPERFTLLYNNSHFVVFNHHPQAISSKTKIIDPRLLPDIEESSTETVVHEEPLFSLAGQSLPAIETRRKLHFYQRLDRATRRLLQVR